MVLTLHLCVLLLSQNKQRLLHYAALDWFCITEVESVLSAVRTESLFKIDTFLVKGLSNFICIEACVNVVENRKCNV